MKNSYLFTLLFTTFILSACGGGNGNGRFGNGNTGSGNTDIVITATAVEVGKLLFEDTNLSANNNQSCASCHSATSGFADPDVTAANPVSEGSIAGEFGARNAPTSAYTKFVPVFGFVSSFYEGGLFIDGRRDTLEEQAKDPFLNPVEMANADKLAVVNKVRNASYANKFKAVYGTDVFNDTDIAYDRIAEAIAAFERSDEMNKFNSKFDCYLQDSAQYPLSPQEQSGLDLFKGKGKCAICHWATPSPASGKVLFTDLRYFNIGVPSNPDNPANKADANYKDLGLGTRISVTAMNGSFRTPTLRNIELTAPYMHNGVFNTLEEVLAFYNIDDKALASPPPETSTNIRGEVNFLGLKEPEETDAIVAFLKTLTDDTGVGICF